MKARKLGLAVLVGILLVTVVGLGEVGISFSQPPASADLLLQENDLPNLYEAQWERYDGQTPEELAEEIARFIGLPLNESDFLEGQATGFLTYSDARSIGIVQGLYHYADEKAAAARYEQVLQGLAVAPLGTETPTATQTEWSWGEAKGQVIDALDPIGSAYAYWFIGVQGEQVVVMQVWVLQDHGRLGPDPADRAVLLELLPRVMERMAERSVP